MSGRKGGKKKKLTRTASGAGGGQEEKYTEPVSQQSYEEKLVTRGLKFKKRGNGGRILSGRGGSGFAKLLPQTPEDVKSAGDQKAGNEHRERKLRPSQKRTRNKKKRAKKGSTWHVRDHTMLCERRAKEKG